MQHTLVDVLEEVLGCPHTCIPGQVDFKVRGGVGMAERALQVRACCQENQLVGLPQKKKKKNK